MKQIAPSISSSARESFHFHLPVRKNRSGGFTIVELLIVIVVIAILATVTVVAYNGVQQKARVATLQSDLSHAGTALAMANAENSAYPSNASDCPSPIPGSGNVCLKSSPGTAYQYTYTSADNSYCLTATNGNIAYMISTANSVSTPGVCPGHTGPVVDVPPNGGNVTTLAGSGVLGFANGPGASAQFNSPEGVAVDSNGIVYVADYSNQRIRKIDTNGVVSTLAGSGTQGLVEGPGASAQFNGPWDVAVDSAGNVYVTDSNNNRIRKITPAGVVSTLATGFNWPYGIAVDTAGNVYVGDTGWHRIRKITPAGVVSTLAGTGAAGFVDGPGASAQFSSPYGVAVDSAGTVYVADYNNHRIRNISPAGVVSTLAGSGVSGFADGTGTSAQFINPYGIAVDSAGTVYVVDRTNNRLRKITPAGVVSTLAGSGVSGFANGTGTGAQFSQPEGVAVDSAGNVYVGDVNNQRIRKIQ